MLLLFSIVLEVLTKALGGGEHPKWKGRSRTVTIFRFAGDLILYVQNPKDSTEIMLGLINEFSMVAGYEHNIQKFLVLGVF